MCDHYDRYFPEEKSQSVVSVPKTERPPHGLMPFNLWSEQRKKDIEDAIIRCTLAEKQIPKEWIAELQTLTATLNNNLKLANQKA